MVAGSNPVGTSKPVSGDIIAAQLRNRLPIVSNGADPCWIALWEPKGVLPRGPRGKSARRLDNVPVLNKAGRREGYRRDETNSDYGERSTDSAMTRKHGSCVKRGIDLRRRMHSG